ncbi:hypothetical protein B0H14DRAFT_1606985 [Mycena olivaceomarginata]|nr:hypothetical protein B0H14DRAFT_1606985 [Mycena olivaceomarginata]
MAKLLELSPAIRFSDPYLQLVSNIVCAKSIREVQKPQHLFRYTDPTGDSDSTYCFREFCELLTHLAEKSKTNVAFAVLEAKNELLTGQVESLKHRLEAKGNPSSLNAELHAAKTQRDSAVAEAARVRKTAEAQLTDAQEKIKRFQARAAAQRDSAVAERNTAVAESERLRKAAEDQFRDAQEKIKRLRAQQAADSQKLLARCSGAAAERDAAVAERNAAVTDNGGSFSIRY